MKDFGINKCQGYKGWVWIKSENRLNKEKGETSSIRNKFSHKKNNYRIKNEKNTIALHAFFPTYIIFTSIWQRK